MKRLTILDEDFINVENGTSAEILKAANLINTITSPLMDMACNQGEDIRTCPSYIELRATINPVESVNNIVNKIVQAIMTRKRSYNISDVAIMSEIYNAINYNNEVIKFTALEQSCSIFGNVGNFNFDHRTGVVELTDVGVSEFVRKLSALREIAIQSLSSLSAAANTNNIKETMDNLKHIALLKEFIKHL